MILRILCSVLLPILLGLVQARVFRFFLSPGEISLRAQRLAVVWGAVGAIVFSAVLQFKISALSADVYRDASTHRFLNGAIIAPLSEELFKGMFPLLAFLFWNVRGRRALLVLGALAGVGFYITEVIIALAGAKSADSWMFLFWYCGIRFGFHHAMFTGLFGLGIGIASVTASRWMKPLAIAAGYFAASFCHFIMNASALAMEEGFAKEGLAVVARESLWMTAFYLGLLIAARRRIAS